MQGVFAGGWSIKGQTQTAGTRIQALVPPKGARFKTIVTDLVYSLGGTSHTLVFAKALAKTYLTAASAATDTTLEVASLAFLNQSIAANDYIAYQHTDGTYDFRKVSSVAGLILTVPAITRAISLNGPVWVFGDVETPEAEHMSILPLVSASNTYNDALSGIAQSGYSTYAGSSYYSRSGFGDPLLFDSGNATAAGIMHKLSGYYSRI